MVKEHLRGILFLAVAGYAAWTFYGRGDAPGGTDAQRAREALELHYIAADIYSPVRCSIADGERIWISCRAVPANGTTGGLFTIDHDDNSGLRIWAVNGRAIQHIGGRKGVMLYDEAAAMIPAAAWNGDPLDIPAALALF